jgi:nucleoside-diphosphate-sugar epimerase
VPVVAQPAPESASSTDLRGVVVDAGRFGAVTGWRPQVPFTAGLDDLVAALAER